MCGIPRGPRAERFKNSVFTETAWDAETGKPLPSTRTIQTICSMVPGAPDFGNPRITAKAGRMWMLGLRLREAIRPGTVRDSALSSMRPEIPT